MKMENMHMVSRSLGIVAVMVFALQSIDPAGAACQSVAGAVCGGAGNGTISSVTGNVSVAQGGGILRATSGASVSSGSRILAGKGGSAQVNLGAGCFTSVAPNSIATLTSRSGLTCLHQNEPFTAQTENAPADNSALISAGIAAVAVGGVVGLGVALGGLSP
jgi:hypothetical protein